MVHGIAEQSGGWFDLRSREGEGTTAEVWLPIAEHQVPANEQVEHPVRPARMDQPLVVLAVDDDILVLTNTIAMLEDLGHTGLGASSGKEALDILRQGPVDLVVTDHAMPQMTGLQLADVIKQQWPELPVIIASGFAEIEPGDKLKLPKLSKPFNEAELAAEMRRVVQATRKSGRVLKFRAGAGPAI